MADLFKQTLLVEHKDEIFEFRVPGPREMARIGARAHMMRRQDAPGTDGSEYGLDGLSRDLYQGMALFEILLVKADTKDNWPYTVGADKKPVVDSAAFPPKASLLVPEIYRGFMTQLDTFLVEGPGDGKPAGEAPVDSVAAAGNTTVGQATPIGA